MITKNAVDVVRDAISLIQRNGWTIGTAKSVEGSYCLMGALHASAYGSVSDGDAVLEEYPEILNAVKKSLCDSRESDDAYRTRVRVIHFNDVGECSEEKAIQFLSTVLDKVQRSD